MNSRRVMTILLSLMIAAGVVLTVLALSAGTIRSAVQSGVPMLVLAGLLVAHQRGFRWVAHAVVLIAIVAVVTGQTAQPALDVIIILLPPVLAAIFLPWYWTAGAFAISLAGRALFGGAQAELLTPTILVLLLLEAFGIILASLVSRNAQLEVEANARRAEESLAQTEAQRAELERQAEVLQSQNEQQRRLLDLVTTLEVPTVTLAEGVLLAPVVGALDSRRALALTSRLLQAVSQQRARLVVLDIAGMASVDTTVAQALIDATQAVRLLGCDVVVTGISAAVATTLTHMNMTLNDLRTARSPQEALRQYDHWLDQPARPASNGAG